MTAPTNPLNATAATHTPRLGKRNAGTSQPRPDPAPNSVIAMAGMRNNTATAPARCDALRIFLVAAQHRLQQSGTRKVAAGRTGRISGRSEIVRAHGSRRFLVDSWRTVSLRVVPYHSSSASSALAGCRRRERSHNCAPASSSRPRIQVLGAYAPCSSIPLGPSE